MADPFFKDLAFAALAQTARNPNKEFSRSILGAQQLQRPADPYLRQQYPAVFGGLAGLVGLAPDEMGGSVLDPNTARVREAQAMTYPIGTALQMLPGAKPVGAGAMAAGRAGERFAERAVPQIMERGGMGAEMLQGMSRGTTSPMDAQKVQETWAGFATPEQYNTAKFYGQNQTERWPAAWAKSGAVTPEEILREKGIVQPPPTQRDKDLYFLESRFSGFMDASKARQFLENDMLKATKKEKDLLRKYYDESGRFIAREEAPVQQAMQEFEQGLTNFMATR